MLLVLVVRELNKNLFLWEKQLTALLWLCVSRRCFCSLSCLSKGQSNAWELCVVDHTASWVKSLELRFINIWTERIRLQEDSKWTEAAAGRMEKVQGTDTSHTYVSGLSVELSSDTLREMPLLPLIWPCPFQYQNKFKIIYYTLCCIISPESERLKSKETQTDQQ